MFVFWQSRCIQAKVDVFGKSGCIRSKVVVFGQKRLYSCKSGYIRESDFIPEKVVVFGHNWLHSGKMVVSGKKVVAFEQSGCSRVKVVAIGQKWLYS